jgi:hypothetical protein
MYVSKDGEAPRRAADLAPRALSPIVDLPDRGLLVARAGRKTPPTCRRPYASPTGKGFHNGTGKSLRNPHRPREPGSVRTTKGCSGGRHPQQSGDDVTGTLA